MNGSGSAPITIDPGWPHGVQQTTLPDGVFRYTPGVPEDHCVKAGYCCPCVRWGRYLVRASAGEARSVPRPRTEANNPIESEVVLSLARGMDSSIDSRPTPRGIWRASPTQTR